MSRPTAPRAPLRLVLARLWFAPAGGWSPRPARKLSLHWRRLRLAHAPVVRRTPLAAPASVTPAVTIVTRQPREASRRDVFAVTNLHNDHWHSHVAPNTAAAAAARLPRGLAPPPGATAAAIGLRPERRSIAAYDPEVRPPRAASTGAGRRAPTGSPRLVVASFKRPNRAGAVVPIALAARLHAAVLRAPVEVNGATESIAGFGERRGRAAAVAPLGGEQPVQAMRAQRRTTAAATLVGEGRSVRPASPPQLVWRERRRNGSPPSADLPAVAGSSHAPAPPAGRAAGDHVVAVATDPRAAPQRAASVPIGDATIERLTQEVMQRIDRRMRIERERRGL